MYPNRNVSTHECGWHCDHTCQQTVAFRMTFRALLPLYCLIVCLSPGCRTPCTISMLTTWFTCEVESYVNCAIDKTVVQILSCKYMHKLKVVLAAVCHAAACCTVLHVARKCALHMAIIEYKLSAEYQLACNNQQCLCHPDICWKWGK